MNESEILDYAKKHNLCVRDHNCQRGLDHEGDCGLAVRTGLLVVRYIDSEDER